VLSWSQLTSDPDSSPQRLSWLLVVSVSARRQSEYGGVVFGGWARMAQTITSFSIVEVAKPNIGESWPARVRADITVNLNVQEHIKHEWEGKSQLWCIIPLFYHYAVLNLHKVFPYHCILSHQTTTPDLCLPSCLFEDMLFLYSLYHRPSESHFCISVISIRALEITGVWQLLSRWEYRKHILIVSDLLSAKALFKWHASF